MSFVSHRQPWTRLRCSTISLLAAMAAAAIIGCRNAQAAAVNPAPCTNNNGLLVGLERRAAYLLASTDTAAQSFRARRQLSAVAVSDIQPVTDATTCASLVTAYDRERMSLQPQYVASTDTTRRVVAVRGGPYYLVFDPDPALQTGEFYVLMVFNTDRSQLLAYFTH